MSTAITHKVKTVKFATNVPVSHAGKTRYLGAKLAPSGRVVAWCRHYHATEAAAVKCSQKLNGVVVPAAPEPIRSAWDICPDCGDFLAWCPKTPQFHSAREEA